MQWEATTLAGPKNRADASRENQRWGTQNGYCVVGGQKIPLKRPRVRDVRNREVPLGSYEMLQQASLMEDSVWHRVMHGLTTRRYSEVVRELEEAYGIEKSTVSEHFIEASRGRLEKLLNRPLGEHALCAMMIDGTCFADQEVVVAIGLTLQGHKVVLGLHQGATENATVVRHLLEDIERRGVDFDVPRLYVLDGGKGLYAAVRKIAGKCAVIQRCQVHKIRNVTDHLTEEYQSAIRYKMRSCYSMREETDARRGLDALLHELMHLNPSAARSLEEGLEETLTMHRLRLPEGLRRTLSSTNLIESASPQSRGKLAGMRSLFRSTWRAPFRNCIRSCGTKSIGLQEKRCAMLFNIRGRGGSKWKSGMMRASFGCECGMTESVSTRR